MTRRAVTTRPPPDPCPAMSARVTACVLRGLPPPPPSADARPMHTDPDDTLTRCLISDADLDELVEAELELLDGAEPPGERWEPALAC